MKGDTVITLFEKITSNENINLAILTLKKNKGSKTPGIDGLTYDKFIDKYPDTIEYIKQQILEFKPQPVLRKEIPKLDGSMRPLGIPTIKDRIIQMCFKQILEPICEKQFYNNSYGFRPERSAENAIAKTYFHINRAKQQFAISVDIKSFFDTVDHSVLLKKCWAIGIQDKRVIKCISLMLKAGVMDNNKILPTRKGTPQGGIISPLLANIYLNSLDWFVSKQWETAKTKYPYAESVGHGQGNKIQSLRKYSKRLEQYIVRYADDFVIFCPDRQTADKVYKITRNYIEKELKLNVNEQKSRIVNLHKKSMKFLGFRIKAKSKEGRYVVTSNVAEKSLDKVKQKLVTKAKQIIKNPNPREAIVYNSMILGTINYYRMATEVNRNLNRLCFQLWHQLKKKCRLRKERSKASKLKFPSLKDTSLTNMWISDVNIYPLYATHKKPMHKTGKETNQLKKNEQILFDKITDEWTALRYQVYKRDKGRCSFTKKFVELDEFQVHHIVPLKDGGLNELKNLTTICEEAHRKYTKELHT